MKRITIGCAVFCAVLLAGGHARADTIYLKNGNQIEGIITRETEESVYIQMPAGSMSLSKSAIESIQRAAPEDAEKTKEMWERDRKRKEREEAARSRFEDRQKAKGRIKYKGTWITPDKLAEIEQREKEIQSTESLQKEFAEMKAELEELRRENLDLKQQIATLKGQQQQQMQEQLEVAREMLQQQKEALEFQKEAEKRALGQRPPHLWTVPSLNKFSPYPTPSE